MRKMVFKGKIANAFFNKINISPLKIISWEVFELKLVFFNAEFNSLFNNVTFMKKILNFDDLGHVFQFH